MKSLFRNINWLQRFIQKQKKSATIREQLKKIKWMLTRDSLPFNFEEKHDSISLQSYDDLTTLNRGGIIAESIDKSTLQKIAYEYLNLLETSTAIYEKNGDYAFGIFCSGWCRFMDDAARKACDTEENMTALNSGKWLCHESCFNSCSLLSMTSRKPVDIECSGGIRIYGIPIFAHDDVIGSINFGYGDPPTDHTKLRELAELYKVNYEDLKRCAHSYESRPDFIIAIAKNRLQSSAHLIGKLVEQKMAEQEIKSLASFSSENPHPVLRIDQNGTLLYSNEAGLNMLEPWHLQNGKAVSPVLQEAVNQSLENGSVHTIELHLLDRWLLFSIVPIVDARYCNLYAIDITERKLADDALRTNNEKLDLALQSSHMGVWQWDIVENKRYFDNLTCCLLGLDPAKFTGNAEEFFAVIHPDDQINVKAALTKTLGQNAPYESEYRAIWKDGSIHHICTRGRIVRDERGQPLYLGGILWDITERKQIKEDLKKAKEAAEKATKAKDDFLAKMSHELRTPMNIIIGMTELTLLTQLDDKQKQFLGYVKTSARNLLKIINDILDIAKIESGKFDLSVEKFSLQGLLADKETIFNLLRGEKTIKFELRIDPRIPHSMNGDPLRLNQIIVNLLANAVKFTECGQMSISVELVKNFQNKVTLKFCVEDSGIGIQSTNLNKIFEGFTQADNSTSRKYGGTGLGLTISKALVEKMGGEMGVESEIGKGSRFYFTAVFATDSQSSIN